MQECNFGASSGFHEFYFFSFSCGFVFVFHNFVKKKKTAAVYPQLAWPFNLLWIDICIEVLVCILPIRYMEM